MRRGEAMGASCRRGLRRGEALGSFCVSSGSAAGAPLPPTRVSRVGGRVAAVPTCLDASGSAHLKNTILAIINGFTGRNSWFSKWDAVYPPIESLRLRKLSINYDSKRLWQLHASGSSAADPSELTRKPPRCSCVSCSQMKGFGWPICI